jgi:hypothetical protein
LVAGLLVATIGAAAAQTPADFYKDKTIAFNIGYSPGGGFDLYARAIARHMSRHIPGNPVIVPRQMPGAGSIRAARYITSIAAKDGTELATFGQSIPLQQALGDPAVNFDTSSLNWIGNPLSGVSAIAVWSTSGIVTLNDAKKRDVSMGATGRNVMMQYPLALNRLIGTRFKIVLGYPGGSDINLAMERGEVDGRGQLSWATLKIAQSDWLRDRKVNLLAQIAQKKEREISEYMRRDVPLLADLGMNDDDRLVLELLSSGEVVGRPVVTTPGVPAERVAILRSAFDKTMKDPDFLAEAVKLNLDVNPISGAELQGLVERIVKAPRTVVAKLTSILD